MPNPQVTKNQHWVPQSYLRRFVGTSGKLEVLDLDGRRLGRSVSPKSAASKLFYYAQVTGQEDEISQVYEGWMKSYEDSLTPLFDEVESIVVSSKQITDAHIRKLSSMISMCWIRSDHMRDWLTTGQQELMSKVMQIAASHPSFPERARLITGKTISDSDVETMRQSFLDGRNGVIVPDNTQHLLLMKDLENYAQLFFNQQWRFHVADGSNNFITSDTPVVVYAPRKHPFYGPTFFERQHFIPLSPRVLLELRNPTLPGKRVKRDRYSDGQVSDANQLHASLSSAYCYASQRETLQRILDRALQSKSK